MPHGTGKAIPAAAAARLPYVPGRLGYSRVGVSLGALAGAGKGDPQEVSHDRSRCTPARRNQGR
jgi:hypothetical protein